MMATSDMEGKTVDNRSAEGKVLGHPSITCGGCEELVSDKYCSDCQLPICRRCITAHHNIPVTKHHKLISIHDYLSGDGANTSTKLEYGTTQRVASVHLGKKANYGFRMCENNDRNADTVVLYDAEGTTVNVINVDTYAIRSFGFDKQIFRMCALTRNKYIVCDIYGNIHIVDEKFQTGATLKKPDDGFKPWAVCRLMDKEFIVAEQKYFKKTRLKRVTVGDFNSFKCEVVCEQDFFNSGALLSVYPDKEHLILTQGTMFTCSTICKYSLKTHALETVDLKCYLQSDIVCMYVDKNGSTLIGDKLGNVYLVGEDLKFEGNIPALGDANVRGIAVRGDTVFINTEEYVNVYR